MNRMNLVILLDRLQELIESAPEVPLSGRALVPRGEVLEALDKVRNAIPEDVRIAEQLTSDQDRVVREGKAEAQRIVKQAEELAQDKLSEAEIVRAAELQAKEIVESAHNEAHDIEAGANEYALGVLSNLQDSLEKTLRVVKRGRDELKR